MNTIIEKMTGMDKLNDQVIASDCMAAAKAGVKDYAIAMTESVTPEVRELLNNQLSDNINFQGLMTQYMVKKGFYHAYDMSKQIQMDIKGAKSVLDMVK